MFSGLSQIKNRGQIYGFSRHVVSFALVFCIFLRFQRVGYFALYINMVNTTDTRIIVPTMMTHGRMPWWSVMASE